MSISRRRLALVLPPLALLLVAAAAVSIQDDASAQSAQRQTFSGDVVVASGGKLGVGTASPQSPLHVSAHGLPSGSDAVLLGKVRDPVNSVRYSVWDVGGLATDQNGGASWRGFHLGAPGITVGEDNVWPRLGSYAQYDTLTDPSQRLWIIESFNSEGDGQRHDIVYKISGRDILYLDDSGMVGVNLGGQAPTEALDVGGNLRIGGELHLTDDVVMSDDICFGVCS